MTSLRTKESLASNLGSGGFDFKLGTLRDPLGSYTAGDHSRAFEYINTVDSGMVHVNAPTLGGEVHLPFGGLKASGVGQREQGVEAVDFFSEVITVYIDYADAPRTQARFI